MSQIKTVFVLGYYQYGRFRYIRSTIQRGYDQRHCINETDDISKAKPFTNRKEVLEFLSMCVTNGHNYEPQEYRKPVAHWRQPNFSKVALKAMI